MAAFKNKLASMESGRMFKANDGYKSKSFQRVLNDEDSIAVRPPSLGTYSKAVFRSVASFVPIHERVIQDTEGLDVDEDAVHASTDLQMHRHGSRAYILNEFYPDHFQRVSDKSGPGLPLQPLRPYVRPRPRSLSTDSFSSLEEEEQTPAWLSVRPRAMQRFKYKDVHDAIKERGDDGDLVFNILKALDIDQIETIHRCFRETQGGLSRSAFVQLMMGSLRSEDWQAEHQLAEVFRRIDVANSGRVEWPSFCDFLLFGRDPSNNLARMEITEYSTMPTLMEPVHEELIDRIYVMPKLNKLVTCHRNSLLSLWSPKGDLLRRIPGHQSSVLDVCHADIPGDGRLVTAGADRTLIAWDDTNYIKHVQWRMPHTQTCLTWASDIRRLYSGGTDGLITGCDVLSPHTTHTTLPAFHEEWVSDVLYLPTLTSLLSVSLDAKMARWDVMRNTQRIVFEGHSKPIYTLAYNPAHRVIVTGGQERELHVWNPYMKDVLHKVPGHDKPITRVVAVENSHELISGDTGGKIKIWDIRRFQCVQTLGGRGTYGGDTTPFNSFEHDRTRNSIITVGRRWAFYESIGEQSNHLTTRYPVSFIMYNVDFDCLAVVANAEVTVWRAMDGQLIGSFDDVSTEEITACCLDAKGRQIVIADASGLVTVLHFSTGKEIQSFLPVCRRAEGGEWKVLTKLNKRKDIHVEEKKMEDITHVSHLGHKHLLVATFSGTVAIFDLSVIGGERMIYTLRSPFVSDIRATTFSRRAHMFAASLASVGGDSIQVWKVDTFSVYHSVETSDEITACVFAENVNAFIAGGVQGRVAFYAIGNFHLLCTLVIQASSPSHRCIFDMFYCSAGKVLVTDIRADNQNFARVVTWSLTAVIEQFLKDAPNSAAAAEKEGHIFNVRAGNKNLSRAERSVFPRHPAKQYEIVYTNLSPIFMHSWDVGQMITRVGITDGSCIAVAVAGENGLVNLYSPHGHTYGKLILSGDGEWTMPMKLPDDPDKAKKLMTVMSTDSSPQRKKNARLFNSGVSILSNETAGTAATMESEIEPLSRTTTVDFVTDTKRYMQALCPFYAELQRKEVEPASRRPFFLPEKDDVRKGAHYKRATSDSKHNFSKQRRERENLVEEAQNLREWKEYISARKRKPGRRDRYVPTMDARAKRLPVPEATKRPNVSPKVLRSIVRSNPDPNYNPKKNKKKKKRTIQARSTRELLPGIKSPDDRPGRLINALSPSPRRRVSRYEEGLPRVKSTSPSPSSRPSPS